MTFEHLIRFYLEDIQTISLQCSKCETTIAQDLSKTLGIYTQCPNKKCEQQWDLQNTHHLKEILDGLAKYLRANSADDSHRPFHIAFELQNPPDKRLSNVKIIGLTGF